MCACSYVRSLFWWLILKGGNKFSSAASLNNTRRHLMGNYSKVNQKRATPPHHLDPTKRNTPPPPPKERKAHWESIFHAQMRLHPPPHCGDRTATRPKWYFNGLCLLLALQRLWVSAEQNEAFNLPCPTVTRSRHRAPAVLTGPKKTNKKKHTWLQLRETRKIGKKMSPISIQFNPICM